MARNSNPALFSVPDISGDKLHNDFSKFLRIDLDDSALDRLHGHTDILFRDAGRLSEDILSYLESFDDTAHVLEAYRNTGGTVDKLVDSVVTHLKNVLSTKLALEDAQRLLHLGNLHFQWGIEPLWVMGTYQIYQDYLQSVIRSSPDIPDRDRAGLEDCARALLLRDMGLMIQGYWEANGATVSRERERVASTQENITKLMSNLPLLVWAVGVDHTVDRVDFRPIFLSPSALAGWSLDSELPIPFSHRLLEDDQSKLRAAWHDTLRGKTVEQEVRFTNDYDSNDWIRVTLRPSFGDDGSVSRIDGILADISQEKASLERLETMATTDSLTGLYNRTLFNDRLRQAIESARRDSSREVVLMLIDLNHFKEINDTLGHPAGDDVLQGVAERFRTVMRSSDTLARLGGDEFAIVLSNAQDGRVAGKTVSRLLLERLDLPFEIAGNDLFVGAAIGISVFPEHGDTADTLLSRADVAMYSVKGTGSGYAFYGPSLDPTAKQQLQLTSDLRRAVERGQMRLAFQPIVDICTGQVLSFEALVRWKHPELGLLQPDKFISLAERSGVITGITEWVTATSLGCLKGWRTHLPNLSVAVNMTGRAVQDRGFFEWLEQTLDSFPTLSDGLEIEITENVLMSDMEHVSRIMKRLAKLGVRVAIDDFGTGYSSLSYLRSLPIQTLKVDRSFVQDMMNDENAAIIVKAVVDMAKNLGYEIIAEGIESKEVMDILATLGCCNGQGFYLGRPIPERKVDSWLRETGGDLSNLL